LKRLPVISIIKETLLVVWQKRFVLSRALIATGLASATLDVAMRHGLKDVSWVSLLLLFALLYVILGWVLFALFAITCHRIVLLGETSVPKYGLLSWTSRETRFFGWGLVSCFYGLLIIGPIMLATFLGALFADFADKEHVKYWVTLGAYMGSVPFVYVVARLSVLFPATAIGERRNTDWAFDTTAKNGWRLVAATTLTTAPLSLGVHALPIDHGLLADFLMRLVDCTFMAIGIVALSLSFRFLSSVSSGAGGANFSSSGHA
jgi:hypothetical protein